MIGGGGGGGRVEADPVVTVWMLRGRKRVRPQHRPLARKFGHGDDRRPAGNAIKRWNLTFFFFFTTPPPHPMKCHDNTFSDLFFLFLLLFLLRSFFLLKGGGRETKKLFISPTFVCTFNLHIKEIPSGPALHIYI